MKKFFSLLILLALLLSLCACGDPPIQSLHTDNPAQYLQLNEYTTHVLTSDFFDSLPDRIPENTDCSYHHYYECSLVGDPHFAVCLSVTTSDTVFQEELHRIENLGSVQQLDIGQARYFFFHGTDQDISEYLDTTQIYDGMFFRFEIVKFDMEHGTIEYISARQNDNACVDPVRTFLMPLLPE